MRRLWLALTLGGWGGLLVAGGAHAVEMDKAIEIPGDYVSPKHVEGATTIQPERAHELWEKGVPFVDPRKKTDYQVGHIPDATRLENQPDDSWVDSQVVTGNNLEDLTPRSLKKVAAKDEPVVFYCNGTDCGRSSSSSALAVKWGWQKVYYFRHGFPGWQDAGYPVESSEKWPEKTRGVDYYAKHPEKARWVNNMCDHISFTAWTPTQERHCTEAKKGFLEYLKERSQGSSDS